MKILILIVSSFIKIALVIATISSAKYLKKKQPILY